jgi:uncharacterized protein YkwD
MRIRSRFLIASLWFSLAFISSTQAQAESPYEPQFQINAYDLVSAVNALRAAYGLAPYGTNSILMLTAQNQADFMAATGQVTHFGPGGAALTQRLLAAGYPLDGDLSLGGFRAENITSGNESISAESAVQAWMGDALHQNTMLSPYLTEIGAGVALANGHAYLVIDCARPTTASGAPSVDTLLFGSGTSLPTDEAPVSPVILNTPNSNGKVLHEVKYGETLWQIAISYGVKIDDIKKLNGLSDNSIYPGNKLLIKIEATPTLAPSTATAIPGIVVVPSSTMTTTAFRFVSATMTFTPRLEQKPSNAMTWAIGIVALAIIGAGTIAWLGSKADASRRG